MEFDLTDLERSRAKVVDAAILINAMVSWFFATYEDPANSTPYDGGYVYLCGGPYDAREELEADFQHELEARFDADELDEIIGAAVDRIEAGGMIDWAKIDEGPGDEDLPGDGTIRLLRASPHRWGAGHVHALDQQTGRTLCGKTRARCPGALDWGTGDEIDCKLCLRARTAADEVTA
jgi:hypothetical protein